MSKYKRGQKITYGGHPFYIVGIRYGGKRGVNLQYGARYLVCRTPYLEEPVIEMDESQIVLAKNTVPDIEAATCNID